jgi:hypothetical protein
MLRVRLVMTVMEDDPSAAVREFVDSLTLNGARDWVYVVEDIQTDEPLGYYNGFGVEVNLEELVRQQDEERAQRDPEDIQLPPMPEFDVSTDLAEKDEDQELIELAEELNSK